MLFCCVSYNTVKFHKNPFIGFYVKVLTNKNSSSQTFAFLIIVGLEGYKTNIVMKTSEM